MKTKILTFALLVSSLITFGQVEKNSKDRSRFGVRGGLNYSNIIYGGDIDFKPKVGFNLGGTYNLVSGKKLTLPVELLYSKIGSSTDFTDIDFSFININFMANYFVNKNFFLEAGMPMTIYLSAKSTDKSTNASTNILEETSGVDVALGLGIGYEFTNRTYVNLRYSYGLLPIFNSDNNSSHLSNLSLNFGYTF